MGGTGEPDVGRDVGGGSKRSPLLEFMRRDLRDNAPRRSGATAAPAKGADDDEENENDGVASSARAKPPPSLARAASTAAALRRWRRDVVPASARGERSVLTTDTDEGVANDDDASDGGSGAESSLDGFAAYASDDSDVENAPATSARATHRPKTNDDRARAPVTNDDDARHRVARRGATAKERAAEEERTRALAEEAEAGRVVELGKRAERDAKRAVTERVEMLRRAAKTHGMIARYREERATVAARAAEEARVEVDERWRLERNAMEDTSSASSFERKTPLPSAHEARLHLAYVREERSRAGDGGCVLCDRGELHSALECSLCEAPAHNNLDATDGRLEGGSMNAGDERGGDPASVAAGELLAASGQAEVDRWRELTTVRARASTTELRLTRKGLVSFSEAFLGGFHGLTSLWLARNRLSALPDLGRLTPLLERLEVSCNLLESLPDGIGQLMFLEHLDVSGNALVRLPSLSGLKAITRLDCAGNRLKSLPVTLSGCATLRELCCNNNPSLEWLPTDLGLFQPELRGVWCNGCALLELPNSLEAATGLVHLDVGRNRLRRLPDSLGGGQQPNLQTLRCGENAITALPAGLGGAVSLRALDASHNALEEVDVLAACATLVEIRLGDNALASLPRNLAGGPRRLKAQLKALAHASSSVGSRTSGVLKPRVFTGWGDGEWDGLRVFDASGNSLRKIPTDLAATLLAGGRTPWRVLLHNNPMQASIRAALGQPDAEDVATLLRYLDALNDELELMDRAESELGDRARRVREGKLSAECPARIEKPELGLMDRSDRFARRVHRRFSVSEDAPRVLQRLRTANPGALERVKPIDEQYLLRCEARKAAAAARARTRWGAAIFSKMKGTNDVKEAAAKLQRRDQLLDAIKRATEEKARRDEEEFRWIHDVELLRSIPFRLRCQLARSCRAVRCTRGERVYAEGDDGDTAFIVVEGRCQTRVNVPKDADEINSDDESEADLIKTEPNGDVVSGALALADVVEDFAKRNGRDPSEAEKEGLSRGRRHGEKACVGLETLLTGAPRPHSLIAKSQRTVLMEISRRELAKCLAEDDASRAKEHALKVTRAYNEAKRAFVETYGQSRGASWGEDAVAEEGADAYRESLLETPPAPSVREALFRAEASRQMSATPGFDAIDSKEERDAMVEDYFRRVKVTAHHLGLGLPDDLYSESDEEVLPWTRTWRANRSVEPPELLGSDPDGSSSLDSNRIAEWESLRATPLLGGGAGLFLCSEPTLTKAELRHVVSAGCRRVAARQDERPLCLENDPGERGCAYVVSGNSRGDIVRARRPTKFDPNPVPERVGVVKPGDVVCALSLLTGAKATQTVIASTAARAPPKMKALEINKKCLRAVVMRRPTVLDAMARVVAADVAQSSFADDARGVPLEKRAANELRIAHRIANAGWRHYAVGWRTWVRVGSTVRAECRRRIIREKLFGGGAGAFFAAAAGASLDAANDDEMIDEANNRPRDGSETAQRRGGKRRGELVDLDNSQALGMAKPLRALIASERAAIAARSTRRVLARAGEVFVQQGFPGNSAFLVLGGSLEALVKKPGAQDDVEGGTLCRAGKLRPGACFGETCLLLGARRAATVRATRDSWLLEVGRRGLEWALRERPALADDLARVAAKGIARERVIGDEAAAAAADDEDDDLGLIDDDARMSSEEHRELVERVTNWVFHGEKPRGEEGDADDAKAPAVDDDGTPHGLRPTRSRLAFGEATKKVMGVLQNVDCFAALDRTQMLVMLREGADLETHPPGSRVCEQGDDRRDTMFVVMEGELEVEEETLTDPRSSAASGKVDKKVLRTLRRGDVFGESCLFTGAPRGCTVTATYRGATLIELSPAAIAPILRNVDSFVPTVAQVLASRLDAGDQGPNQGPNQGTYPDQNPDASIDRAARLDASIRLRHDLAFPGEDAPRSFDVSEFGLSEKGTERSVIDESLSGLLRARHPFFRRFTSEELAAVAARGVAREIGTGKHLCRQGDAGKTMFIVVSGVAMVFLEERVGERAVKRKVGEVVAGQCFGEECALRAGGAAVDRVSTIIASPPGVRVVELGAGAFEAAFARRPALVDLAGEYLASLELV